MNKIIVIADEKITVPYVSSTIRKLTFFFNSRNKNIRHFYLSFEKTKDVDMFGVLLIYKFLEYSVSEACFNSPSIFLPKYLKERMKFYGFHELVSELMAGNDTEKEFQNLKIDVKKDFFIAPIALFKGDRYSSKTLNQKYYPQISNYYNNEDKSLMIFQLLTELYSNFSSHAEDETQSIMVAHGNASRIEIACADTGIGIIQSFRKKCVKRYEFDIIKKALSKGITSKPSTNHMGYGLWYIDEVVRRLKGKLHIISSDIYYKRLGDKIWLTKSPFWQGTIVYLDIPLNQSILISDLEDSKTRKHINFI